MMSREEGRKGFEVAVKVDSSLLFIPPDELKCEFDECKNWRLHEKEFCQLHYIEKLRKMKNQNKGVKRNRGEVEKVKKNDEKKKGKKNDKGLKKKSNLDDNGGIDENREKRNGKDIVNEEESEKIEAIVPVKNNGGNRNEVALMEKCDLDVNNGVGGDDLVMEDLESKLVQKRTEIRRSTRSMTVAGKNGNIITEKKSEEGGLDHGEDDKSGYSNLDVSREEKKEVLVQKNEKKKTKQPSKNKGVEIPLMKKDGDVTEKKIDKGELLEDDKATKSNLQENKKDEKMESPMKKNEKKKKKQPSRKNGVEAKKGHLEIKELMQVEDDKKGAERNLREMEEDKQDEKMEIPVMKEDEDITEKKIDKGELVEDDKDVKRNLQGNKEDEKMEVPMRKNGKKQKKKVKKDKVEDVQKNDHDERQLLLEEDDKKGNEKNLHEREEDKKEEVNNPVKKNEKKKKVKKDKMEVVKRNDVGEGQLLQVDDANKGDEKILHEQEDKKNEIDIPVKKNKKNKSDKQEEEEKKTDLGEEGILQVENDKGSGGNLPEREEGKEVDIPVKKNDKKRKGVKNMGEEKKTNFDGELLQVEDEKGSKRNLQELEGKNDEKIDIPVKKCKRNKGENKKNQGNAENKQVLESSNMPKDSSELLKVEGKSGSVSEDKNYDFAGSSHKLVGPSKGHVLKSNGEPLVETKAELRHNTRSTVGGVNVISEDGEQRIIVQALQAMPTGGAKNKKVSKKTVSFKVAEQNPKESKKDKKVKLPVKKKMNEVKGSLAKHLDDGASRVVKISSNETQGTVSNVEDESLEDFEEAKVDFAGKEKKMKGCVSKSKDETVVDKQTLEPKIELRRSRRTTTDGN